MEANDWMMIGLFIGIGCMSGAMLVLAVSLMLEQVWYWLRKPATPRKFRGEM